MGTVLAIAALVVVVVLCVAILAAYGKGMSR
jgi:hypothetical protein